MVSIALIFSVSFFVQVSPAHAAPVEDTTAWPQRIGQFILDKASAAAEYALDSEGLLLDIKKELRKESWAIAYKNTLRQFLNNLAHDTGVWLGSGGQGQQPTFITEGWGEYLKNAGDSAAGTFIETLADNWGKKSQDEKNVSEEQKRQLNNVQDTIAAKQQACDALIAQCLIEGVSVASCPDADQCYNELELLRNQESAMFEVVKQDINRDIEREKSSNTISAVLNNICRPNLQVQLRITAGLNKSILGKKPKCTLSKIIDNWEDEINDPNFLNKFQANFDPWENDLGIALSVHTGILQNSELEKEINKNARLESSGINPVIAKVTQKIVTPGRFVTELAGSTIKESPAAEKTPTESIIADAINIFAQTLAGNLLDQWFKKGIASLQGGGGGGGEGGGSSGLYNPQSTSSSALGGIKGAEARFAGLAKANIKVGGPYEILRDLTICRNEDNPGPNECIITQSFRQAIERKLTVREAIAEGLLDDSSTFGFTADGFEPNYKEGYPYRSLIVLRKHRIIPVGWEIAARYIKDIGHEQKNLRQLINDFTNGGSPFYGLVDPNWVLKAPEAYCGLKGAGPVLVSDRITNGIDQNKDGDFNDPDDISPTRQISRDANYCADDRSCIKERPDGTCQFYGYCTEERRGWDYGGDAETCEPRNQTCQTFEDKNGNDVSYLQDTLNFNNCSLDNAGCTWYCTDVNISTGEFTCSDGPADQRRYFDRGATSCGAQDVGCHEFIRITPGTNLVKNGSFEEDWNGDGTTDDGWSGTRLAYGALGTTEITTDEAVSGTHSLKIKQTDNSNDVRGFTFRSQEIYAEFDETTYTFSYWVKTPDIANTVAHYGAWMMLYKKVDGTEINGVRVYYGSAEQNGGSGAVYTIPADGQWHRVSYSFTTNPRAISNDFFTIETRIQGNVGTAYFDDIQLEVGNAASSYSDYGAKNVINEKVAPDYLDCNGYTPNNPGPTLAGFTEATCVNDGQYWFDGECRKIDTAACGSYALSCFEDEVGCKTYTPKKGGPAVPGIVGDGDTCPAECVGYDTFKQELTYFEPSGSAALSYFIPATGKSCNAKDAGCTEFTNLDRLAEVNGGNANDVELSPEAIEYYATLRQCVLVDEFGQPNAAQLGAGASCEAYFSWIGSDETGYQLASEELKSIGGSPIGDGGVAGSGCESQGDALADPNCREFFDAGGNTLYRWYDTTVTCAQDCHPYRMSRSATLHSATQEQNCTNSGGVWTTYDVCTAGTRLGLSCKVNTDCDTAPGAADGVCGPSPESGYCIYHAIPGQGQTCGEAAKDCRAYAGNASRNTRTLFTDTFENESDIRQYSDGTISSESTNLGGHSQKVIQAGGTTETNRSVSKLALIIEYQENLPAEPGAPLSYWEDAFGALGYKVIKDTDIATIDAVADYQPDIVVSISYRWGTQKAALLNQLYDAGYALFTQGNDSINNITPIAQSSGFVIQDEPVIHSTGNHFIARGWNTSAGSKGDTRERILAIHPAATVIAQEWEGGNRYTEAVYLAESGKGRWYHHQPLIFPVSHPLNTTLFANAISALDSRAGEAIQNDKAYELSFWAKGTGDMSIAFSGAPAGSEFTTNLHLTSDWKRYTLGPVFVTWDSEPKETLDFATMNNLFLPFFIDNVQLTEVKENIYVIAGSWKTPESCDQTSAGDPWPQYALGCEAYTATGGTYNLKSFSGLCREEAIGCEAMIDTQNSNNPLAEDFNIGDDARDDVRVPADNVVYIINDPNTYCNTEGQGCRLLGEPQFDRENTLTGFEATYLRDDPDTYDQSLCTQEVLWCEEYFSDTGLAYFRDPLLHTCEWKDGIGGYSGWYKRGSVAGAPDCPMASHIGFNGQTVTQPAGGWAGLCPADESGCTQYVDPISTFNPNILLNGDFNQDTDNNGVPDGWVNDNGMIGNFEAGIQGSRAVKAEEATLTAIYQNILLDPNTLYELSGFVRDGGDGSRPRLYIDNAMTGRWGVCQDSKGAAAVLNAGAPGAGAGAGGADRCFSSSECTVPGGQVCIAGILGIACNAHSACDTKPESGDGRCNFPVCNYAAVPDVCDDAAVCPSGLTSPDGSMLAQNDAGVPYADEASTFFDLDYISNQFQRFSGRFHSGRGGVAEVYFGANHGGEPAHGTGHIFDNVELRKVNIDYLMQDTLDATSCNGAVDYDNGCILLNAATRGGALNTVTYDPDHNFSTSGRLGSGASWVVCSQDNSYTSACEANTLVKARPDRSCGEWLYCETLSEVKDENGIITNQCYGIGLCNQLDENGKCASAVQEDTASAIITNVAQLADLTGYSVPGYNGFPGGGSIAGYKPLNAAVQRGNVGLVPNGGFEYFDNTTKKPYSWSGTKNNYEVLNNPLDFERNGFKQAPEGNSVLKVSGDGDVFSESLDTFGGTYYLQADINTIQAFGDLTLSVSGEGNKITVPAGIAWHKKIAKVLLKSGSARVTIRNSQKESTIFIDDVRLLPVLDEVGGVPDPDPERLIGSSCRLYPTSNAPSCSYHDQAGKNYKGTAGYCLQWDTKNTNVCQLWWPVDTINGDIGTLNLSYNGRIPLYYCVESDDSVVLAHEWKGDIFLENDEGSSLGYLDFDQLNISEGMQEFLRKESIDHIELKGINQGGHGAGSWSAVLGGAVKKGIDSWCDGDGGFSWTGCSDWSFIYRRKDMTKECRVADFCTAQDGVLPETKNNVQEVPLVYNPETLSTNIRDLAYCNQDRLTQDVNGTITDEIPDGKVDFDKATKNPLYGKYDCIDFLNDEWDVTLNDDGEDMWQVMAVFDNSDSRYFKGLAYIIGDDNNDSSVELKEVRVYVHSHACNVLSKVVTSSGEGKPWSARVRSGGGYTIKGLADLQKSDLTVHSIVQVTYDSDYAPFGSVVPPAISIDLPDNWDGTTDFGRQPLATLPPNTIDFLPPYQVRAGNPYDCTAQDKENPCNDLIDNAVERLQQLFVKSYGAWEWKGACANPGSFGKTCAAGADCDKIVAGVLEPGLCEDFRYRSIDPSVQPKLYWIPPTEQCVINNIPVASHADPDNPYCGIRPQAIIIKVNGKENPGDLVPVNVSGYVTLTFNTNVDPQQLPIKSYVIDWGDGKTTSISGLQSLQKSDPNDPEIFQHFYSYWDILDKKSQGIIPENTCAAGVCKLNPKIRIYDNWGWCTGAGDMPGCGWNTFAGGVAVNGLQ